MPGSRTGRPPVQRTVAAPAAAPRPPRDNPVRRLYTRARKAWDRPLTAYYLILGGSLLITVLGLVMVYSASQIKALQIVAAGARTSSASSSSPPSSAPVLLLVASRMPVKLHRALAYPLLAGAVFLMVLVQVPGIGMSVNGNQNWISLGGSFQLQPSEFGKLALVLWGADLLARKQDKRLLTQWKHMLVPLVPVAFLLLGLIMLGGDMGTAIILTAILFGLLWLAGAPDPAVRGRARRSPALDRLHADQDQPEPDGPARLHRRHRPRPERPSAGRPCTASTPSPPADGSVPVSAQVWKNGANSPKPHTDFIFAITGEELGLAGTLSVLALFAALGYAGIRVAGRTEDPFVRYAAGGVTTWITAQAVINIGAVLGLLPIAGVPLPLFSYGGSALLPTMFAVGLLIAFAREEPARARPCGALADAAERPGVRWKTMRRRVKTRPSGER